MGQHYSKSRCTVEVNFAITMWEHATYIKDAPNPQAIRKCRSHRRENSTWTTGPVGQVKSVGRYSPEPIYSFLFSLKLLPNTSFITNWTLQARNHRTVTMCWRRLLRVPWTARRSNQSILKEIIPGCSLEGMMLKLKLQYFGHLMRRVDSLEKTLMLGGIGGRRRRGRPRMRWLDGWHHQLDGHEFEWTPGVGDGQGGLACCNSWDRKELDMTERLNWTEGCFCSDGHL